MKLQILIVPVILAAAAAPLAAQVAYTADTAAYTADTAAYTAVYRVGAVTRPTQRNTTGKPLSAREERHTLQVLADGTHIDQSDSNAFFRDDQGRTRVEQGPAGNPTSVVIQDPVAGFVATLNPANKTARKMPTEVNVATVMPRRVAVAQYAPVARPTVPVSDRAISDDLGTEIVNGVAAKGRRTTMIIATGQIGNDRPISIVNEVWTSDELEMIVKSSNKDPRFGETTYQLTNIVRGAPSASLFQIPAVYTVQ